MSEWEALLRLAAAAAIGGGVLALVILVLLRRVEERMDLKSDTAERSLPNRD